MSVSKRPTSSRAAGDLVELVGTPQVQEVRAQLLFEDKFTLNMYLEYDTSQIHPNLQSLAW
jgi:hypothetical protein